MLDLLAWVHSQLDTARDRLILPGVVPVEAELGGRVVLLADIHLAPRR